MAQLLPVVFFLSTNKNMQSCCQGAVFSSQLLTTALAGGWLLLHFRFNFAVVSIWCHSLRNRHTAAFWVCVLTSLGTFHWQIRQGGCKSDNTSMFFTQIGFKTAHTSNPKPGQTYTPSKPNSRLQQELSPITPYLGGRCGPLGMYSKEHYSYWRWTQTSSNS